MLSGIPVSTRLDQDGAERIKSQKQDRSAIKIPVSERQPISIVTVERPGKTQIRLSTLWDTGATDCYINHTAASKLDGFRQEYHEPVELRLFDGSVATTGPLTEYVEIDIKVHPLHPPARVKASVTRLCGTDLVLGWKWMIEHGIEIDAPNTEVTLDETLYMGEGWTGVKRKCKGEKLRATWSRLKKTTFPNNIPLLNKGRWAVQSGLRSTNVADIRQETKILASVDQETEDSPEWIDGPGVAVMDQDDPQTTAEFEEETRELLETLPEYCHDYLDIFRQEQGTKTLPPHREYDMRIDLQPTSKMPVSKLYPLAEHHRRVLLETLDRETKAGRIRQSNAAYGSPMFFVPKKDGRSRMVVDYR